MAQTGGAFLVERLLAWGVERIFGYPGDDIKGILGGLEKNKDKIEFIQVRHEESAAFMATAHAKFTGKPGICLATSGPGTIHLLNGLYDAKLDHQPVVAIVGQQARMALGGNYQQEVDILSLFKNVASDYAQQCSDVKQLCHLVDRSMCIAQSERTVTCIIIPNDIQEMDYEDPPREHGSVHSGIGYVQPKLAPSMDDLQQAAAILNAGNKVAILAGAGALHASDELIVVADLLGAGVAKALLGKAALPDDLPFVTGSIGSLGTKPSWDLMMECDTLLMVGSSFPYAEFLPRKGQAKGIQIDIDPKMLGIRYPMDLLLQGDSKETLRNLIPLLVRKEDRSWQLRIEKEVVEWWKLLDARAANSANSINPQLVFRHLSDRLPDECIITGDSGSTTFWYARDIKMREGMMASLSGALATMGSAVPYAIAAKFAHPLRTPIAIAGDGAMQMLGNNELITIARYWKQWETPHFIILVINNHDLNMVSWEQRALSGQPKFEDSQVLPDFPFAAYARMLGLEGVRIATPQEVESGLDKAFSANKPVVVEAITDPNVPILPPHISTGQAKKFFAALLKGDKDAWSMVKQTYKEVVDNYLSKK